MDEKKQAKQYTTIPVQLDVRQDLMDRIARVADVMSSDPQMSPGGAASPEFVMLKAMAAGISDYEQRLKIVVRY